MGKTITITSGKGGVGKSTVTVGLSIILANLGNKVLLIDNDSGLGSLDHFLNIEEELVYDICDVVNGNCDIIQAIYEIQGQDNLYLLPAPSSAEETISPSVMKQITTSLSSYYDYILIDCPAGMGRGFKSAIEASTEVIVVANADPISIKACDKVRRSLEEKDINDIRLIINRFSPKLFKKSKLYYNIDEIIDSCSVRLLGVIPEDYETVLSMIQGLIPSEKTVAMQALKRIACRLEDQNIAIPNLKKL